MEIAVAETSGTCLRSFSCVSAAEIGLDNLSRGVAVGILYNATLAVAASCLVQTGIAGVDDVLEFLLALVERALDEDVVEFTFLLGLIPVERLTVCPWEHLDVLFRRVVCITLIGTHVLT